jgi:hypothetical protein
MTDKTDKDLLNELGVESGATTKPDLTPVEERIIAGFEDIQLFVDKNEKLPNPNADDIFERIYATRLGQIRNKDECVKILTAHDHQDLLTENNADALTDLKKLNDEALLSELGIETETITNDDDITQLRHIRSPEEIKAAEEIANRTKCEDFEKFKPIFDALASEIKLGLKQIRPFQDDASVAQGNIFILNGQQLYIAERGETFINDYGRRDSRLRVIYDNKTESNILMRTLTRALNKDENGRRITDPNAGPLFSEKISDDDKSAGTIYVCRSLSDNPYLKENKTIVHKIGVTSTSMERRLANAEHDPTFLMAKVEVVATYELFNIDRTKLEALLHKFFADAQLKIEIKDRFGKPVTPREWFCVPLNIIEQAIEMVKDETIVNHQYDAKKAEIIPN